MKKEEKIDDITKLTIAVSNMQAFTLSTQYIITMCLEKIEELEGEIEWMKKELKRARIKGFTFRRKKLKVQKNTSKSYMDMM